jgi:hypothetical protein
MEIEVSEDGFINALRSINGGALVEELDRELIKGVQAIFDHGGSSEITLKFKVSRIPGMEKAVNIRHNVAAKHPQEERPAKAMFITAGSGLSDQYQEQQGLPLGTPTEAKRPSLSPISHIKGDSA